MGATFALVMAALLAADPTPPKVTIEKLGDVFEFKVNGELVTKYHTRQSNSRPYFWPLNVQIWSPFQSTIRGFGPRPMMRAPLVPRM